MTRRRHAQIPPEVIAAKVSHGAFRVYAALALHADKAGVCFPKISTLCKRLGGADRSRVQKWIRELERAGLVKTEAYMSPWSGGNTANTYTLPLHPSPQQKTTGAGETAAPVAGDDAAPGAGETAAAYNRPEPTDQVEHALLVTERRTDFAVRHPGDGALL